MQIKVKNISYVFSPKTVSEFTALKDVSVNFKQGEFISIIGETGSGKTTFIEHLNALLRPSKGELLIDKMTIKPGKKKIRHVNNIRKKVGIVFQFAEYQLFEETIAKDIIFGPINMGVSKEKALKLAEQYIELVGMDKSFLTRSPFALSGGQKRRVALAGILAMEPDYLVFDEPTAGLDPEGEKEMYKIFRKLHKKGKTIIIVTHNLNHVLEHSERTIIFYRGKIVADGSSIDLMYNNDLLTKYNLEPPRICSFIWDLEAKGKTIGKIRTIKQLANRLNKQA